MIIKTEKYEIGFTREFAYLDEKGDYTTYYLAMAYEVDPTPVATIEEFKREMSGMD